MAHAPPFAPTWRRQTKNFPYEGQTPSPCGFACRMSLGAPRGVVRRPRRAPPPAASAALTPAGELAAHRAVYELKLASTRGKGGAVAARGRILYDFSGSLCEGYTLEFRQVSELNNGEGKVTLSDLRSTTWEDSAGG